MYVVCTHDTGEIVGQRFKENHEHLVIRLQSLNQLYGQLVAFLLPTFENRSCLWVVIDLHQVQQLLH